MAKSHIQTIQAVLPNLYVRDPHSSRVLRAAIEGDRVVFSGGRQGQHSIAIDVSSRERVLAHWEGYCEANNFLAAPKVGQHIRFPRNGRSWHGTIVSARVGDKSARVRYERANGSVAIKRVDMIHITYN